MGTFYDAPNDYRNYLAHHGVKGMKWGIRKQYPIVGRAKGYGPHTISKNPLISQLQFRNMERNVAKAQAETKKFDNANKDLVEKRKKAMGAEYDYVINKLNSYHQDKKFKASVSTWINKRVKSFEAQTGKSGANLRKSMEDSFHSRDISQSFDYMKDFLIETDSAYRDLNNQTREINREYAKKRSSYGKYPASGGFYFN